VGHPVKGIVEGGEQGQADKEKPIVGGECVET